MADHCQSCEGISFAGIVALSFEEGLYEIRGVRNKYLRGVVY